MIPRFYQLAKLNNLNDDGVGMDDFNGDSKIYNHNLLRTIQIPKDLKNLDKRLPKPNYEDNKLINKKNKVRKQRIDNMNTLENNAYVSNDMKTSFRA